MTPSLVCLLFIIQKFKALKRQSNNEGQTLNFTEILHSWDKLALLLNISWKRKNAHATDGNLFLK